MEEENSVKLQLREYTVQKEKISKLLSNLQAEQGNLKPKEQQEIRAAVDAARRRFEDTKALRITKMQTAIAEKEAEVERLLDSFPNLEKKEISGKIELQQVCDQLTGLYSQELVDGYVALDTAEYSDDAEVFKDYQLLEQMVGSLSSGDGIITKLYSRLSEALSSVVSRANETSDKEDATITAGIGIAFVALLLLKPVLVADFLGVLAIASYCRGLLGRKALDKLYNIRQYISTKYDVDVFQEDKQSIMAGVKDFLHNVLSDYTTEIESAEFREDEAIIRKISEKYVHRTGELSRRISAAETQLQSIEQSIKLTTDKIMAFEAERERKAAAIKSIYLETVESKTAWLSAILFDISPDNELIMAPNVKGNSVYISEDSQMLMDFSRLYVYQCMIHMHSDLTSQLVLDYKYMGGSLLAFQKVPAVAFKLCYRTEEIDAKIASIMDDMQSRAQNVLSSCQNLEQFNELMSTYGSVGENYWIIHIFGLSKVDDKFKFFLKNGPKVGYYFKFYLTIEDVDQLGDSLPVGDISQFAIISNTYDEIDSQAYLQLIADGKEEAKSGSI